MKLLSFILIFLCASYSTSLLGQGSEFRQIVIKLKADTSSTNISSANFLRLQTLENDEIVKSVQPFRKTASKKLAKKTTRLDNIYFLKIKNNEHLQAICEELEAHSNVIYAEPYIQEQLLLVPDDPDAQQGGSQGHLEVIHAYDAWDITTGDSNIVIGIIDTGLDLQHEDISDQVYTNENEIPNNNIDDDENGYIDDYLGYDFADRDSDPQSENSFHGNRVGGVAGASTNNGIGIAGIGFNTKIAALKAFQSESNLSAGNYEAIVYAADNGYDVVNLSWGSINSYSQFNQDIINYAVLDHDVVVVAAAGNTPEELDFYPASYDHVLSVSASNLDDTKASFATYSRHIDLVAPGSSIYSTFKDNTYARDDGTSYSAPMVAGTAALIRSEYPELNAMQVMELIRVNTDDIYTIESNAQYEGKLGSGRLNMAKALRRENNTSMRINSHHFTGLFDGYIFHDDTVAIDVEIINFLESTEDVVSLTLSSSSPFVTLLNTTFEIPLLSSLDTFNIVSKAIYVHPDTPPNEEITILCSFEGEEYNDSQYISFQTEPDHIDLPLSNLGLTVAGNGNLGFASDEFQEGIGVVWNGQKIASSIGVAIVTPTLVSDNWPLQKSGGNRSQDFTVSENIHLENQPWSDFTTSSTFEDKEAEAPIGIAVEQKTYSFDSGLLSNALIIQNRLTNTTADTIKGISTALLVDWDLVNIINNRSHRDGNMLISFSSDSTLFTGLKLFNRDALLQAIDKEFENSNESDIPDDFSDSLKIALVQHNDYDSAGWQGTGNDILNIISSVSDTMPPLASTKFAFLMVAAPSKDSLLLAMMELEEQYLQIINRPILHSEVISCEGASQVLVPETDTEFRFFEDAIGEIFIAQNDSLFVENIMGDTSIYIQKVVEGIAADIQRIDILVISKVADFTLSEDTLYLDSPTRNQIQCLDQSLLPLSWLWDFDNGSQATIQHPNVNFTVPGSYQISLSVENELGCSDTEVKTLLVVERPSSTDIGDLFVCFNESITLSTPQNDSIHLYADLESQNRLYEGRAIFVENIFKDTTLYVSRIENGFESLREKVNIIVSEIEARFSFEPDTQSEESRLLLINTSTADSIIWQIEGAQYFTDSISIDIENTDLTVMLEVFDSLNCYNSTTRNLQFSPSPTPALSFQQPCEGGNLTLRPENGVFFGLYADENLNELIEKNTLFQLEAITDTIQYFLVGLDSILPSPPIEITIQPTVYTPTITVSPENLVLSESRNVQLSTSSAIITSWQWYLNQQPFETAPSPILFLDSAGSYSILVETSTINGCLGSDSLTYEVINERPLLSKPLADVLVYPNPSSHFIHVKSAHTFNDFFITDLSGKVLLENILNEAENISIDLSGLNEGVYILHLSGHSGKSIHIFQKKWK